ncbi:acetyltransferase [Bacterioplanes sanyensis]|uniref:GNAT family N-acetyltransferase n=1 Tax=Bacterioplanes sanyensis TaxID=1249553 RepID=UPI00167B7CEE|nr:GNAT family N-acetyltransferase [Bacterioplanes sanyensis]GGY56107.1 acetyltransferase [Bacterioplanes sanyensis]
MKLIEPNLAYEQEFADFYQDFFGHDRKNATYYQQGVDDFPAYVKKLNDEAVGKNLQPGYVPCDHFWCIADNGAIAGAIRVRHHINTPLLSKEGGHIGYDVAPSYRRQGYAAWMLQQVLPVARQLGIEEALITADAENFASRKVIERNGGRLEAVINAEILCDRIARYWVPCIFDEWEELSA